MATSRERFLIESAERMNRVLDRDRLLQTVRDLTREAVGADACSVLLPGESGDHWDFPLAYNQTGTAAAEVAPTLRCEEGLAGWVMEHEAAALINDTDNDPRVVHLRHDGRQRYRIHSILAVPLYRGTKVIGVLEALNARSPEGFTPADLELLAALGNQASVALENSRLYSLVRREKRTNEILYRLGLGLARTLNLDELLPLVIELLGETIDFDAVGIYLYHRGSGELEWFQGHGYPEGSEEQVRLKVGQGAVGWVAERREAVVMSDVARDGRYLNARPGTRSEMTIPLHAGDELVGVLNLESDRVGAYGDEHLRLLSAFGNQAAIAIQRAWLHNQAIEKRRLEEEVHIARRIQRRLLPSEEPVLEGLDIAAFNHPSLEVSGDVYDFIEITRHQLGIMIGDVSGKGIPAGIIMATFRASLRAEIRNNYAISTILDKVNRLMVESLEEGAFVTAVYGVLDRRTGRFTYANAGHNPPLLVRASGRIELLEEGGTILGSFRDSPYREGMVDLEVGDRLAFYTDGITEAFSPAGEMFGMDQLAELLRTGADGESSRTTCRRILEAVRDHVHGGHMEDDLTAILLQLVHPAAQDDSRDGGYP